VIVVLVALALAYSAYRRRHTQQLEDRRHVAAEHREEAESRRIAADKQEAAADEQAAIARRQAAEAEERARQASETRTAADAHEEHAREVDPDETRNPNRDDETPAADQDAPRTQG